MFTRPSEPGLLYVAATLIPLAAFVINLCLGFLRFLGRRYRDESWGESLYWLMGGDKPGRGGALLSNGAIGLSCLLSVYGLGSFRHELPGTPLAHGAHAAHGAAPEHGHEKEEEAQPGQKAAAKNEEPAHETAAPAPAAWAGRLTWVALSGPADDS